MKKTLLLVDDEKDQRARMRAALPPREYRLVEARSWEEAVERCASEHVDLVLLDRFLGRMDVTRHFDERPDVLGAPVLLVSAWADDVIWEKFAPPRAPAGLVDLLHKPYEGKALLRKVRRILEPQPEGPDARTALIALYNQTYDLPDAAAPAEVPIIRASNAMSEAYALIRAYAREDAALLITGDTGVGKELAAREAHRLSPRGKKPFKPLNCAAIPEALLESELFGHTRGAFTGAQRDRDGLFQQADGGTVFLDEVGDLAPSTQAKLLRVLESGEIQPLGADDVLHVDVRVIAATHRDLRRCVREDRFRADLYYRIGMMEIPLPRLTERGNDIRLLIEHFIRQGARDAADLRLAPETLERLLAYPWPGNVRELRFVIRAMTARTRVHGPGMTPEFLPPWIRHFDAERLDAAPAGHLARRLCARIDPGGVTKERIDGYATEVRRALFEAAYRHCRGNVNRLAKQLGLSRSTLYLSPWKGWIEALRETPEEEDGQRP